MTILDSKKSRRRCLSSSITLSKRQKRIASVLSGWESLHIILVVPTFELKRLLTTQVTGEQLHDKPVYSDEIVSDECEMHVRSSAYNHYTT